ncbi:hypothetical protein NQ038_12730 [Brevibacterium sp. 50QC2O2]|uniref:hypothetical protein n=1 Tax=unclassified Brevibacterium TaxID=2614124 RepID=UPI00211CB144|nr:MULTISPECIES: hypothetical protein [unclassified Brevibacterium]MCQ9368671.1 hypothetical protein [Brevibacterium sp. 91QC2O2]MCQ9389504.1 hypothetical protein [Brevibacterium sp. 50QC2O2]
MNVFRVRLEWTIRCHIALTIVMVVVLLAGGIWGALRPHPPPHAAASIELHDEAEILNHEDLSKELATARFYHPGLRLVVWTHWDQHGVKDDRLLDETWKWAQAHPELHLTDRADESAEPRWADDFILVSLSAQKGKEGSMDSKHTRYAAGTVFGGNLDYNQLAYHQSSILHETSAHSGKSGSRSSAPYAGSLERLDKGEWGDGVAGIVEAASWLIDRPKLQTFRDHVATPFLTVGIIWPILGALPLLLLATLGKSVRGDRQRLRSIELQLSRAEPSDHELPTQRERLLNTAHDRLAVLDRRTIFTTFVFFTKLSDQANAFSDAVDELEQFARDHGTSGW